MADPVNADGTPVSQPASGATPEPTTDWRTGLPEPLRAEKTFESIKGKDWTEAGPKLATQYLESQKYNVGAIKMPKADAPETEWDAFHAKLGRPEAPDKYGLKFGALPEAMTSDAKLEAGFADAAHKAGLSPKQAQSLADWWTRNLWDTDKQMQTDGAAVAEGLQQEWGGAYKRNLALAQRAVREFGPPELAPFLEKTGLGNNAMLVKFFARIGHDLLEDTLIGEGGDMLGAEDAKREIATILGNSKHAYFNTGDPGNEIAKKRMTDLYALAYGTLG